MISIQQAGEQAYQGKPEGEHTNSNHQLSARKDFKKLSTCHKFGLLKKNYIAKSLSSRQKSYTNFKIGDSLIACQVVTHNHSIVVYWVSQTIAYAPSTHFQVVQNR
jgi:hypothetical protein